MTYVFAIGGALLLVASVVDTLWTSLWVDGHAGPITRANTTAIRWVTGKIARGNHRALSLGGPAVVVSVVGAWALLQWTAWVLIFSANPRSLLDPRTHAPADLVGRIYFAGYSMFTLGNGDYAPNGHVWQLVTAVCSLGGLFLLTLSVTYILALVEAVVGKRSFASQVWTLGNTAEQFVINSWDGQRFAMVELQIVSMTEQLNLVTEQHQAFPLLHYYHEEESKRSVPVNLTVFSDAILLFETAVSPEVRPGPSALRCARMSVEDFLGTLDNAYIQQSDQNAGPPEIERLRQAGIPLVPEATFTTTLRDREKNRRLLKGFLESESRPWPSG